MTRAGKPIAMFGSPTLLALILIFTVFKIHIHDLIHSKEQTIENPHFFTQSCFYTYSEILDVKRCQVVEHFFRVLNSISLWLERLTANGP